MANRLRRDPRRRPRFVLANATVPAALVDGAAGDARRATASSRADIVIADGTIERIAPPRQRDRPAASRPRPAAWSGPASSTCTPIIDKGHIWPRQPNPDGTFAGGARRGGATTASANWTADDVARPHGFRPALRLRPRHVAAPHASRFAAAAARASPGRSSPRCASAGPGRIELQAVSLFAIDAFLDEALRRRDRRDRSRGMAACSAPSPSWSPTSTRCSTTMMRARRRARPRPRFPRRRDRAIRRPARSAHIADAALRTGFPGRIVAGHCCSLAHAAGRRGATRRSTGSPRPASPSSRCRCAISICRTATPAARRAGAASRCCTRWRRAASPSPSPPTIRATRSTPMATSTCWRCSARRCASSISTIRSPTGRGIVTRDARRDHRPAGSRQASRAGRAADLVLFRARTWTELLVAPAIRPHRAARRHARSTARCPTTRELDDLMGCATA